MTRYALAAACTAALVAGSLLGRTPPIVTAVSLSLSVVAYILYAADKRAALLGNRRTPERTLHLLALLGGWPGALVARHRLRHKTRKQPFRVIFWIAAFLNIAACFWVSTRAGLEHWQMVMGALP